MLVRFYHIAIFFIIGVFSSVFIKAQENADTLKDRSKNTLFKVDVIVFLHDSNDHFSEKWPDIVLLKSFDNNAAPLTIIKNFSSHNEKFLSMYDDLIEKKRLFVLPKDPQQLKDEEAELLNSQEYTVLIHKSWIMPIYTSKSTTVKLVQFNSIDENKTLFEGIIRFRADRQVYTEMNFWISYLQELQEKKMFSRFSDTPKKLESFELKNSILKDNQFLIDPKSSALVLRSGDSFKIMRNYQLKTKYIISYDKTQYIDSPVIGVLIKVVPYDNNL